MRKKIIYAFVFIFSITMMQMILSCTSEEGIRIDEAQRVSRQTRGGPELNHELDETTIEIVKADLIGAFEGFLKGFDYAVDNGLSQDETYAVVIASAVSHSVLRSHQAYVKLRLSVAPPPDIFIPTGTDESDLMSTSNEEGVLTIKDQILYSFTKTDLQFVPLVSENIPIASYPEAAYIGKMHNAILPELKIGTPVDFNISNSNYSPAQMEYLQSAVYEESIVNTYNNPVDFSKYYNYNYNANRTDPHLFANLLVKDLLLKINNLQEATLENFDGMLLETLNSLTVSNYWSKCDLGAIRAALMTGAFSAEYWTIQHPVYPTL